MQKNWIVVIVIAVLIAGGLYLGFGPSRQTGPEAQQPAPHALDQTPSQ